MILTKIAIKKLKIMNFFKLEIKIKSSFFLKYFLGRKRSLDEESSLQMDRTFHSKREIKYEIL